MTFVFSISTSLPIFNGKKNCIQREKDWD